MDTSYLTSQIATIIGQLHGHFDDIGVPSHERESRESELFAALSETLHNQLRLVAAEKTEMTDEANRMIKNIKQMEASLDDIKTNSGYELADESLKVSFPLLRCLQKLKEKHGMIAKLHKERYEQVRKLVQALESYSSHLESNFVRIALPPTTSHASVPPTFDLSPSYLEALDNEFTRVYEEYTRRIATVKAVSEDIIKLWAELGTPQAQTDSAIVKYYRDVPEQLGLHEDDLARLRERREKLVEEKRGRERRLKELKSTVEGLWDRLGIEEPHRRQFLASNRGCGVRVINEYEDELARLNEMKRQNLHLFVEDARYKIQSLWDDLYFSEEEMLEFTPAFSGKWPSTPMPVSSPDSVVDVCSDALLSAHEAEISRLEALKEQRAPTLLLIDKHRSLINDRNDLQASSQDVSRLMGRGQRGEKRDPTRLLREEKMRKRIAKDLPKVEAELKKTLERWEDEYGRPFCVHGHRYLDELAAASAKAPLPRSKTPNGLPPASKPTKPAPASHLGSSTMRSAAPSRIGAKTPTGSVRGNPLASSTSTAGGRSPSKIPARVPLGNMRHGNNSPERHGLTPSELKSSTNGTRKMGPPTMAPPPRMRNLMPPPVAPEPVSYERDEQRSASVASSGESVRYVSPEDVYDDREQMSYVHPSRIHSQQTTPQTCQDLQRSTRYGDPHPQQQQQQHFQQGNAARQFSTTSSATNTVSGSENWETYDDASEPEMDASEAYYAKLRAARGKRFTPDGGHAAPLGGPGKKVKGIRGPGIGTETMVEGPGGQLIKVSGSEAGWTSEETF
ncbi:MAG: hypothetical protein M1832_003452 [Thelocarpon impressellum]|nr:MAG: hypothetical protein M1832_003452 [Thelocarpon impressellum]